MIDDRMTPSPVERRVYERLHETRAEWVDDKRRARSHQALAAEMGDSVHAAFIAGLVAGASLAGGIATVGLLLALGLRS